MQWKKITFMKLGLCPKRLMTADLNFVSPKNRT